MTEKFVYWQRIGILQFGCAEILEEAQHQPLFYVFRNEGLGCHMVQPYAEERHVETIYAQWKLQIDILPYLVSNYNARKHRILVSVNVISAGS